MKGLYFSKRGDSGAGFWRCGICGEDRPHMTPAVHVQIGNQLLAIVCLGACASKATAAVSAAAPLSFPDLDAEGYLL